MMKSVIEIIFTISLALLSLVIILGTINGCAPIPEDVQEQAAEEQLRPSADDPLAAIKADSLVLGMHRSFAYTHYNQGNYETARAHYDTIRTYDYNHWYNIYRRWADSFIKTSEPDSALWAYEQGVKYFPEDIYLRTSLAHMYRNFEQYDDAIVQQQAAIKMMENNYDEVKDDPAQREDAKKFMEAIEKNYGILAEMYVDNAEYLEAIETYKILVEMNPDNPELNTTLTNLIRTHLNPTEYLKVLKENVEKFPDDPKHRIEYARALAEDGNSAEAAKQYRIFTQQNPDEARGWRGLAQALDNQQDFAGAINAYKKLVDLEPDAYNVMVSIGRNYLILKEYQNALYWGRRAKSEGNNYGPGIVLMADAYLKTADAATGDKIKYDDRLVYLIAYGLFEQASKSEDSRAATDGRNGMSLLEGNEQIPLKEHWFQHQNDIRPKKGPYKWINNDWQEVKYIDTYLKKFEG